MARAALIFLLCAVTAAALLDVAEGKKKVKEREDALQAAGKGKSPKVLRGAEATTPESQRREQLGGCLNSVVDMASTWQDPAGSTPSGHHQ
jgi:hypothetical protein